MATRLDHARWTYSEFARLPDDGNRYEVIGGEVHVTPAPRPIHQFVVTELTGILREFVATYNLGWVLPAPCDVLFADGEYVEPDFIFVRRERRGIITDRGIEGAPDLVVEVASDSTAARDRGPKREQYARFGVPLYWIADPVKAAVEVYRLADDPERPTTVTETLTWRPSRDAPGLEITVAELFRGFE